MLKPPFRLASANATDVAAVSGSTGRTSSACCDGHAVAERTAPAARIKLLDLDAHLHCSVIGTCLSTAELRKLMARFLSVRDSSDLDVHHEAVRLSGQSGPVVKALQKVLDQRHELPLQRFARARDDAAIESLWDDALRQGEVPGAYWAVLTHRHATPRLRLRVFGDVHMLSHLVGSANRADIRRLVALEADNAELHDRAERQQARAQALANERERTIAQLRRDLAEAGHRVAFDAGTLRHAAPSEPDPLASTLALVEVQAERRERPEQARFALDEASRLRKELDHSRRHAQALSRELRAAETQLREIGDGPGSTGRALHDKLSARRVFYVGGRPSSTSAIRDLVLRHGGEFQQHDGGLEDRKGRLASGVAWATLVVFPVDCIDHDSAGNLKKQCVRQGVAYLPLRGASVASFAAALAGRPADGDDIDAAGDADRPGPPGCLKHG